MESCAPKSFHWFFNKVRGSNLSEFSKKIDCPNGPFERRIKFDNGKQEGAGSLLWKIRIKL